MSNGRFALGDGVSSVTGRHIGRGIVLNRILPSKRIKLPTKEELKATRIIAEDHTALAEDKAHHQAALTRPLSSSVTILSASPYEDASLFMPYKKKSIVKDVVADRTEVGTVEYRLHHVKDYQYLNKVLGIKASISSSVAMAGSISTDMKFAETVTLSRENLTLIVIGEFVSHVDSLPKDAELALDGDQVKMLNKEAVTFKNSNGDHYVSSVKYGVKLYAEIKILRVTNEKGEEFEHNLESKLHELLTPVRFGLRSKVVAKKDELLDRADMSIRITHVGVPEIGFPAVASRLDSFVEFLKKFDTKVREQIEQGKVEYPIGHSTEPYTSLLKSHEASHLHTNVVLAKELLLEFDHLLSRVRLIMPTAKAIMDKANKVPKNDVNREQIDLLNNLYRDAQNYQKCLTTQIKKIEASQTDIATMKARVPESLIEKMKSHLMTPRPTLSGSVTPTKNEDERSLDARESLLNLSHQYTLLIDKLERDIENVVVSMEAELLTLHFNAKQIQTLRLPNTDHFHIRLPVAGATFRWRITDEQGRPLDDLTFDIAVQKRVFYHKDPRFTGLRNNQLTEVTGISPRYRYKIARVRGTDRRDYDQPFVVMLFVCGDLALQIKNGASAVDKLTTAASQKCDSQREEYLCQTFDENLSSSHSVMSILRAADGLSQRSGGGQPNSLQPIELVKSPRALSVIASVEEQENSMHSMSKVEEKESSNSLSVISVQTNEETEEEEINKDETVVRKSSLSK